MLVMRKSQMEAFEKVATQRFEIGLFEHIRTFFPQHAVALGEQQLGRVVRYGLQRAGSRGLRTERAYYLYLALMFMLGSQFDEEPQLPWAASVKAGGDVPEEPLAPVAAPVETAAGEGSTKEETAPATPDVRIEQVYQQAMAFLDRTIGAENEFLRQTLNVLRHPQVFEGLPAAPSFGHRLLLLLQTLAPEKYQALGDETMRDLVRFGYEAAKRHGVTTEHGIMDYLSLAFVLGSKFDRDPLYPWAGLVLEDPALTDPAQKETALRKAALEFLAKCLPTCPRRAELNAVVLAKPAKPYQRIVED